MSSAKVVRKCMVCERIAPEHYYMEATADSTDCSDSNSQFAFRCWPQYSSSFSTRMVKEGIRDTYAIKEFVEQCKRQPTFKAKVSHSDPLNYEYVFNDNEDNGESWENEWRRYLNSRACTFTKHEKEF